jgi:hypothetical protein
MHLTTPSLQRRHDAPPSHALHPQARKVPRTWTTVVAALRSAAVAILISMIATPTHAEEVWIGRPAVADYLRHSVESAVRSAADYQRSAGAFQGEITAARRDYFAAKGRDKVAKGERLGVLLFAKDLMLASPVIAGGFTQQTTAAANLFAALNGGQEIDGGIRASARPAFNDWIRAVRYSIGARRDDAVLIVTPARLQAALIESAPVFEKYRRERDLVESRMERGFHPRPTELPGQRPLHASGREISVAELAGRPPRHPRGLDQEIEKVSATEHPILVCRYGPSYNEAGSEYFGEYFFWKRSPPTNIARLLAYGNLRLNTVQDRVLNACPRSEKQAMELARAPRKVTISEALRKELQEDIARRDREARQPKSSVAQTPAAARPSAPALTAAPRKPAPVQQGATSTQTAPPSARPLARDRHAAHADAVNACIRKARPVLASNADRKAKLEARAEREACVEEARRAHLGT